MILSFYIGMQCFFFFFFGIVGWFNFFELLVVVVL